MAPSRGLIRSLIFLSLLIAAGSIGMPKVTAADSSPRLKVLFLGDNGHHAPRDRFAQLQPVFAGRAIDLTYTENMSDLNKAKLDQYNALLIYANITKIEPAQEQAILDYVEAGGAFVPLHCASYCFLNSPRYIALVGAQFLRHGTGEFDTSVVAPAHPIMKGFEPFRTWDETYVHTKHNEINRQVLQTRAEGQSAEPWTWTRTQGKGRVFYTAYGHDARTWQNPGFHNLVERGIRWAVGKGPVFETVARIPSNLPAFAFDQISVDIPNYVPGRQWGKQGEAIRRMQQPLSPADSSRHQAVPPGFEARLFAADPQIFKPICMNWDDRGRLWIAETVDYPNTKRPAGQGRDRLTICEDTDGDAKADRFTVFAEDLSIPTSFTFANGGVVVLQAPETLFLKDTNGDGKADLRKILFTGWGVRDTHAGPSNLRWGLDNWIWGIVGYSGFDGTVGGEKHKFQQAIFRFKPDGSKLEVMRSTSNNSWGLGFSEDGLVFGSTANGCPSVYLPVPNRYYESVRGLSPRVLASIAPSNQFYPITERVRQVDFHGGFTAAAGHALYTARTYPPQYWNQTAFVTEPTGHLVATFTLNRKASDVAAYYGWNLLASDDEWSSPIAAEVGPDGNVWVIDWYNYIVQHNPTPQGFKTGPGNAYETPLRDRTHGRIYRVVHVDGKPSPDPKLNINNPQSLIAGLKSDNQFWRMHAQRLLVERGNRDIVPALLGLIADKSVDAIGLNVAAIHALTTLDGLRAISRAEPSVVDAIIAALEHPSAGVRRIALQVLPKDPQTPLTSVLTKRLYDEDPQVRLAALLAIADQPPSRSLGALLAKSIGHGLVTGDRWLADAATAAAAKNAVSFLDTLADPGWILGKLSNDLPVIAERVAEHWARGRPGPEVVDVLSSLERDTCNAAPAILTGIARGWPKGHAPTLDHAAEEKLLSLAKTLDPKARAQLVRLVASWGNTSLDAFSADMVDSLLTATSNASAPEAQRAEAAHQLIELRPTDPTAAQKLLSLITIRTTPTLATALIDAVAGSAANSVGPMLVDTLASLTPSTRSTAVRALLRRADWTTDLVAALETRKIAISELSLDQQQALASNPSKAVAERARALLAKGGGLPDPNRQKVIDSLAPKLAQGGDPVAGKLVFTQQCAKCHRHGNEGGRVGPDLSGTAALPRSELLIHILDPSRSVEGTFVQYMLATTDGQVLNGLLAGETRTSVELVDAEGKRHPVLREDIDQIAASKKSLMPEGFENQLSPAQLNDLLAFLTQRGKYVPIDLRKVATSVTTRGMFIDADASVERLVFDDWSTKIVQGVPFSLVDPQGERVPNAVLLYSPSGTFPPKMPRSVTLNCGMPARAIHLLSGVSGWGFPFGDKGSVSMIVRIHYKGGGVEDHQLRNGIHFADYIRVVDVPGSTLAFRLNGQQIRYLTVQPEKSSTIDRIELVKGPDQSAPVVMAVTVETAGGD
jgi:putative membrane-bound dehydrogenase-like protein